MAKVLDASIDGESLHRPKWNRVLQRLLILAKSKLSDFNAVSALTTAKMVPGCKLDDGYNFISEADFSVQGMSANDAARALVMAANGLEVVLEIGFMWRPKEGALHPGERARLTVLPTVITAVL